MGGDLIRDSLTYPYTKTKYGLLKFVKKFSYNSTFSFKIVEFLII